MVQPVTRVDAVRAGWEFPGYIHTLQSRSEMSEDEWRSLEPEVAVLRRNLRTVFQNPAFPLESVEAEYLANRGSNDVLDKALHGLPSYVMDWFRVGQVAIVAMHQARQDPMGGSVLGNHLARVGVPEPRQVEVMRSFSEVVSHPVTLDTFARMNAFDSLLQSLAAQQDRPVMKPNIWINGSFFLVAILSIFVAIRVVSGELPPVWIAVVFIGGILSVLVIGVLALRANDQIGDNTFLQAVGMVVRALPLLGRGKR